MFFKPNGLRLYLSSPRAFANHASFISLSSASIFTTLNRHRWLKIFELWPASWCIHSFLGWCSYYIRYQRLGADSRHTNEDIRFCGTNTIGNDRSVHVGSATSTSRILSFRSHSGTLCLASTRSGSEFMVGASGRFERTRCFATVFRPEYSFQIDLYYIPIFINGGL